MVKTSAGAWGGVRASSTHYILGPFGPPCDLRHYGGRIAAHGGKNAKKRAVVAVVRKLAVVLHVYGRPGQTINRSGCCRPPLDEHRKPRRKTSEGEKMITAYGHPA